MKLLFLCFTYVFLTAIQATAQCTYYVYPGTVQITTNQTINAADTGMYWICSGLTVNVQSSEGTYFLLEENVTLNIMQSEGDIIIAKNGSVINNYSDIDIVVNCDTNQVASNNLGSGWTYPIYCAPVVFDYTYVPGMSCPTAGINETNMQKLKVYPNPVMNGEFLKLDGEVVQSETIMNWIDLSGRVIGSYVLQTDQIMVEGIQPGIYVLELKNKDSYIKTKLVVK